MKSLILPLIALLAFAASAQRPQQMPIQIEPAQKLNAARAIIENYYVENVDNDTIVTEAIKAMLNTLDPHSAYSTPAETKEFTEPLNGKFSGIGEWEVRLSVSPAHLPRILDGLEKLHKNGLRHPIAPSSLTTDMLDGLPASYLKY